MFHLLSLKSRKDSSCISIAFSNLWSDFNWIIRIIHVMRIIRVILIKLGQYHGCWCPDSLHCQVINIHNIGQNYVGPCFTWGRITTTCVMSVWRNDRNSKYMFRFLLKNSAHKELITSSLTRSHIHFMLLLQMFHPFPLNSFLLCALKYFRFRNIHTSRPPVITVEFIFVTNCGETKWNSWPLLYQTRLNRAGRLPEAETMDECMPHAPQTASQTVSRGAFQKSTRALKSKSS